MPKPGPVAAPYGSWKSPITSDLLVAETVTLGQLVADGSDVYWSESRPTESGRSAVVHRTADGRIQDVTPAPFDARTRVHEYGGGDFTVAAGTVFFSNAADQRLYRQDPGSAPRPITPVGNFRYANATVDRRRNRLICIREEHPGPDREAVNTLVAVDLEGRGRADAGHRPDPKAGDPGEILVAGNDFYVSPRLSPDGSRLAWLTWNHPNMPWDGTELWVASIGPDGRLTGQEMVAGGPGESTFQPEWSPDGTLYFVSDRTGWWNLYRLRDGRAEPLAAMEAEFGLPQWWLGQSTYAFASAGLLVCAFFRRGAWHLATLDTTTLELAEVAAPYTYITGLAAPGGAGSSRVYFCAGSPTEMVALVAFNPGTGRFEVLRRSSRVAVDPGYLSVPEEIAFPTEGGRTAYAYFYRPRNRDHAAPPGELPPLLVMSHGGPTSATSSVLRLGLQYWTSRGFAVADVNYGGSTGYGRSYRERLHGQWGIVDVDDCVNVVRYLVGRGDVDASRAAITGGSAGGYTTLAALTFRDVFKAGASLFGVSDLEGLAKETHKLESHYLDGLVGPYPEARQAYLARSPLHHADRVSCPVLFFQGLEDKAVPPNQAESMVEKLRAKGLPVAYLAFEGEGHGFRRAENIKRTMDGQLYFFSRVFGFDLPDAVEPIKIDNL